MDFEEKKQVAKNLYQLHARIEDPLELSEATRSYKKSLDLSSWADQKDIIGYYQQLKKEKEAGEKPAPGDQGFTIK